MNVQSLNYVILGLDIATVALLILNFLVGLIRGCGKSLHRLLLVAICATLFLVFLTPISQKVGDIKLSATQVETIADSAGMNSEEIIGDLDNVSLNDAIVNIASHEIYQDNAPEDSKLIALVQEYSTIIVKLIIYIVGLFLLLIVHILVNIIILIIRAIAHAKKRKRKPRIVGGLLYILRYAVFFILVILPLYGTISLSQSFAKDLISIKDEIELDQTTVDEAEAYIEAVDGSYVRKFVFSPLTNVFYKNDTTGATLDAIYVGNAISVKTSSGVEFKFFDEYANIQEALPAVMKIYGMVKEDSTTERVLDLSQITDEEIDALADAVGKSNLLKSAIPAGLEYAEYTIRKEDPEDAEGIVKKELTLALIVSLEDVDWNSEVTNISNLLKILKNHKSIKIDLKNVSVETLLADEEVVSLLKDVVSSASELSIVKDALVPVAYQYLVSSLEANNTLGVNIETLKSLDTSEEFAPLINVVLAVMDAYNDLDIAHLDKANILSVVENEKFAATFKNLASLMLQSKFITELAIPYAVDKLQTMIPTEGNVDLSFVKEILTKDNMIALFDNDNNLNATIDIAKDVNTLGLLSGATLDLNNTDNLDTVLDLAKKAFSYTIFTEEFKGDLVNTVVNAAGLNQKAEELGITIDLSVVDNWDSEINALIGAAKEIVVVVKDLDVKEFNKETFKELLDSEKYPNLETYLNKVVDKMMESKVFSEVVIPGLSNTLKKVIPADGEYNLSFVTDLLTADNMVELLDNESNMHITIDLLRNINDLGLLSGESIDLSTETNVDKVVTMVKEVFNYTIVSDNAMKEKIFTGAIDMVGMDETLTQYGINLNFSDVTDWNKEIDNMAEVVKDVMVLSTDLNGFDFSKLFNLNGESELDPDTLNKDRDLVANVVDRLATSVIFGDSVLTLVNRLSSEVSPEYNVTITSEDRVEIEKEGGTGWKTEVKAILNIVDEAADLLKVTDSANLPADTIKQVMVDASKGVIASKIVGTILNKVLDGKVTTDFTKRENMANCADAVYNLVVIANAAQTTTDLSNPEEAKKLVDAISNLADSEEVVDTVKQVANEFLGDDSSGLTENLTKEEIQEAAEVIEDVLDTYSSLTPEQKENFTVDDLPEEVKEKLSDSDEDENELAALIFKYLF